MKPLTAVVSLVLLAPCAFGQGNASPLKVTATDRLGLRCAQILQMTSAQWIAKFSHEKDPSSEGTLRAISVYGKCYDARTDHLEASIVKSVGGSMLTASGKFRDFDQAVNDFMSKALAASDPPADAVKVAYAALYEKQFRYEFYSNYQKRGSSAAAPEDLEAVGDAKNEFGKRLNALPSEKIRDVHAAFSRIFDAGPISDATKLALYRFAIFCLEKPSAEPFSPPPF